VRDATTTADLGAAIVGAATAAALMLLLWRSAAGMQPPEMIEPDDVLTPDEAPVAG
jgi:hypothetical protein